MNRTTAESLIPVRLLVQPQVVSPTSRRRQMFSSVAIREAKTFSALVAASYCDKGRMLAVSMNPPDEVGLRVLRFILLTGDRRYWSWSATKKETRGKVRNSLMWELDVDRGNLSRGLTPLLEDGIVEITEKANRTEQIVITTLGKAFFAEVRWRSFLRGCAPESVLAIARTHGWQEVSIQIDTYIGMESLDPTRKPDILTAMDEQFKNVVLNGGGLRLV